MTEYVIREESGKIYNIAYYYCGDFYFKPDGSKVYLLVSHNFVKKRAVSSPWEVNTISDTDEESNTLSEFLGTLSIHISTNGTKMYIAGADTSDTYIVAQYSLSTPWSISTISLDKTDTLGIKPRYICFKPDGTKMYVLDGDTNSICQFSLSTAWDIGTATSEGSFSITEDAYVNAFFISDNGKYMVVAGNQNKKLYFYKLDTPWDISTATYTSYSVSRPYSILGVYISPFMLKVYDELYLPDYTAQLRQFMVSKVEWIKAEWIPKPSGWSFVRPIKITEQSGNNLSDYQVLIELNSSNFDFSKAKADGSDIRFLLPSGKSIPYWIESWNKSGQSAKVWVKVPSIPANSSTVIYMAYGNPSAGSESNASATFTKIFSTSSYSFDYAYQFKRSSNPIIGSYTPTYSGATIQDGVVVFDGVDDYVDLKSTYSNTNDITVVVKFYNENPLDGRHQIWSTDNGGYDWSILVGSPGDGGKYEIFTGSGYFPTGVAVDTNTWHKIGAVWDVGTGSKVWLDGNSWSTSTISTDTSYCADNLGRNPCVGGGVEYWKGRIAWVIKFKQAISDSDMQYLTGTQYDIEIFSDGVYVRKYTDPEPTFTVGPEIWL